MKVLVVGSGTMGSGIAQVIASSKIEVILNDINNEILNTAYNNILNSFNKLVQKEKITESQKEEYLKYLHISTELRDASDVNLVIEAASENIEIKKSIFKKLDEVINKDAILASNTSSLSITEIASFTSRPCKVIGVHFFNPPYVMKLIEVIKGYKTSEETFSFVKEFVKNINKEAVEVKEAPGFVVNRILIPMINEAIGVLADNVASVEDIDKAMMLGANHPLGPLALADLIGLDVVLAIMNTLFNEYKDSKYRAHPLLTKMVRANMLGRKTKQGFYKY